MKKHCTVKIILSSWMCNGKRMSKHTWTRLAAKLKLVNSTIIIDPTILFFSDFPIQALELLWEKYSDYDTWLGSGERLIDGVRHVYQVSTDGKRTITYHHYLKGQ